MRLALSMPPSIAAVLLCGAYVVAAGGEAEGLRPTANPDSAIVFGVADEFFAEYAARAADLDYPGAQHDRLPDNSLAGLRRWQEREDEWLNRLDAVDADALRGSAAWALNVSLRERLEASVQFRVCRRPLWNVDPDWGWHIDFKLPDLARSQPVGTPAARAAALRRWSGFGRFVDTEIDNLREGMREGYVAPRAFVEEVIEQVGRLAGQAPEASSFYDPARRDTTPEFREAFGRILSDEILPALQRYQRFLSQEYLPRARSDVALTSMPDGLECYRAFLRRTTGLPLDETQVDSIGRALLPRVLAERDSVARTRYGLSDGRALSEAIAGDSALTWGSHAEALTAARSAVARAADLLPRYFSRLPPIPPLVVDTMTTEDALNASYGAYYAGIPADTALSARVVVNPMIFDHPGNRGGLGPLAYHEGLPGHHLQAAFDRAFGPSHRYALYADDDGMAGIAGFMEGWATYAAHFLALEMGLLSDAEILVRNDYEIGQLGWFVITDGIHMRGWSQDQVRDTWRQYLAGWDDDVLNYTWIVAAGTPGYELNYLLGALEIQRLRTLAERELGAAFDIREFHDQVLRYGDIPLGALREVVQRWIRETLGAAGTAASFDTVHVAPPTRVRETDRASILAALEEVRPGGTVQFAPGTYLVGELISSEAPRITLLGHPEGTTLRGCEPDEYEQSERAIAAAATAEAAMIRAAWIGCGMFELTGGNVTVRNLTFELSRMGLLLGCCHLERRFGRSEGGYLIEGNTFRNSANGIRPWTTERSVIRGNRFVNTFHAISGAGSNLHVLDNDISAPEPGQVPGMGHPSFAIALGPITADAAEFIGLDANGEGNVIAGNRIDGHPDGIFIAALPGTRFRNNEIRDNTIRVARVPIPPSGVRPFIVNVTAQSDSTIVGIPLLLYPQRFPGAPDQDMEDGMFEDNLIARNRFVGAEGIAIAIRRGSRNRIVENTIRGIRERRPFPGNTVISSSELWQEANGSGVWISPGSDGNEIVGNIFDDIAAYAVVLEGDSNRVVTRSADDRVRDAGTGNQVITSGGAAGQTLPPGVEKPADAAEVFPIWPGPPPGTAVTGQPEQVTAAMGSPAGRWVRNVEVPTLTAFLPDPASATGTAVVVAPGGANLFLSIDHEGYEVARWFAERGVAAFVLRYRVRPTPREPAAFVERLGR